MVFWKFKGPWSHVDLGGAEGVPDSCAPVTPSGKMQKKEPDATIFLFLLKRRQSGDLWNEWNYEIPTV